MANKASMSSGVSTAVGSSRISTRQSWCKALMISARWRSPTDSSSARIGIDGHAETRSGLLDGHAGLPPIDGTETDA